MRAIRIISVFIFILVIAPATLLAQQRISYVPDRSDAVIYQINIRTFSEDGNLKGITGRIDSIKSLGANVIYLMPIYPIGKIKSVNSTYCVSDYQSVNPEFGTLEDLQVLVKHIHSRQMAVILDWVPNHTSYDHKWIGNKSWYLRDSTGKILSPPGTPWRDVAQLNFSNMEMREEMISSMKYWIQTANIDGFRCDYADGPPFGFWKQALDSLRSIDNHQLLMLAEGKRVDHYQAGFDYNFGFSFFEGLKDIFVQGKNVTLIDSLNRVEHVGATKGQEIVRYTTNHDVNGSDGTPQEIFGGERGAMAAFIVSAYMNSIPMIYNGQEVGTPYRLVFPFTSKNIDWTYNPSLTAEYKKILAFYNNSEVLRKGKLNTLSTADVCAFVKEKAGKKVLVLCNMRDKTLGFEVPKKFRNVSWRDAFTGSEKQFQALVELKPFEYIVVNH